MQHLILILPLIGIVIFWIFPPDIAIPIYLLILVLSAMMFWAIVRAMKKHPKTGSEGLIGATASVVSNFQTSNKARYVVRIQGELWNAHSSDILKTEELVTVTGVNGLTLFVQRVNNPKEEHATT
jgi:membrane protein implicated in regulation of membrane protease activity